VGVWGGGGGGGGGGSLACRRSQDQRYRDKPQGKLGSSLKISKKCWVGGQVSGSPRGTTEGGNKKNEEMSSKGGKKKWGTKKKMGGGGGGWGGGGRRKKHLPLRMNRKIAKGSSMSLAAKLVAVGRLLLRDPCGFPERKNLGNALLTSIELALKGGAGRTWGSETYARGLERKCLLSLVTSK